MAPSSEDSTSTLAVSVATPPMPSNVSPPITATEPPTAQHEWSTRAVTRAGIDFHCNDTRSSLHKSLTLSVAVTLTPYTTTSPGRVLRCSFAPSHAPCTPRTP